MNDKLNILVVDDEPINIHVVAGLLENDYHVKVATNGVMALSIVEKAKPDIILLDVNMPDMDGFEVAKAVYKDESNKDIPIIFFSADSSTDYIATGFDLGAFDYVIKPVEPKSLLPKIAYWAKMVRKTIENKEKQQLLD